MPVPVEYEGQTYMFPDGTPREKIVKYLKEKVVPAKQQAAQQQAPLTPQQKEWSFGTLSAPQSEPKPEPRPEVVKQPSVFENPTYGAALMPIKRTQEISEDEFYEGLETAKKFRENPNPGTAAVMALGGLQTAFAGQTGMVKGLVKEPTKNFLLGLGAPEEIAEFGSGLAEGASYLALPGALIARISKAIGTPGFQAAKKLSPAAIKAWNEVKKQPFVIKMVQEAEATKLPSIPDGSVRFYHGGTEGEGARWLTQDYSYAKGYADKTPGATVKYVDIPETSPLLKKAYDDIGTSTRAPYAPFEAPDEIMAAAKPVPLQATDPLEKIAQEATKRGLPIKIGPPPHTEADMMTVIKGAKVFLEGKNLDAKRRITDHLIDAMREGEIPVETAREFVENGTVDINFLADRLKERSSASGRFLGSLGWLSKELGFVFNSNPKAKALFSQIDDKTVTFMDRFADTWKSIEEIRRGFLVSQFATFNRNIDSQSAMAGLAKADDMISNFVKEYSNYSGMSELVTEDLNLLSAIGGRLTPAGRARLNRIFESKQGQIYKKLLNAQLSDQLDNVAAQQKSDAFFANALLLGKKSSYFFNIPNRAQEHFFLNIAYEAKMAQELKLLGKSIDTVDPKMIPAELYEKALKYAREKTFASSAKSDAAQKFLNAFNPRHTGMLGSFLTTIQPFPRFAYANALPFIWEHSPFGFYKILSKKSREAIASGKPEEIAQTLSRATLGTLMFKSAWHIRQSESAGPKYYQYKLSQDGDSIRYLDLRAFAPFTAYLFLAEAALHPEKITWKDYVANAIGLNKIAGTGLIFADILSARNPETATDYLKAFFSAYIGSYTVPIRTAKDVVSHFQPEEGIRRQVRESGPAGLLGRSQENIPWISRELQPAYSPLTTEVPTVDSPLLRQISGLSVTKTNPVQREVDRINLPWEKIYPRTGITAADNALNKMMSPVVENMVPRVMKLNVYKKGSDAMKREILGTVFKLIKADATRVLKYRNPTIAAGIKYDSFSEDQKTILKEVLGPNHIMLKRLEELKTLPVLPDTGEVPGYGLRNDGTSKGQGFLGPLQMTDGSNRTMTELSVGVNIDGHEVEIPTLVPTLTKEEVDYLRSGKPPTKAIINKATVFARGRLKKGLSPFK